MALLVSLAAFILVLASSLLLLRGLYGKRLALEARLLTVSHLRLTADPLLSEEGELSLLERTFFPMLRHAGRSIQLLAPASLKVTLSKRLNHAGSQVTPEQYFGWYLFGALCGLLLGALLSAAGETLSPAALVYVIIFTGAGACLPELHLRQKIRTRQVAIVRALPDVLDLLTVSMKAGLGFDSALQKVTEKMSGPLPTELQKVLHEVKMGVMRRDALRSLAQRTGIKELQSFVSTLIQADQLGVSISNVLHIQSESVREQRRQVAEENALKAPIKMLFPLVLFIFPTLFIVLLGPAVLQIMKQLAGM